MVGFEPTLSSPPDWRNPRLSYILIPHPTGWAAGYDPAPRRSQGRMQRHYTIPTSSQYPREESNLNLDLRTVVCLHHTPRMSAVPQPGLEPGTAPSDGAMIPFHHQGSKARQYPGW